MVSCEFPFWDPINRHKSIVYLDWFITAKLKQIEAETEWKFVFLSISSAYYNGLHMLYLYCDYGVQLRGILFLPKMILLQKNTVICMQGGLL